MSFVIISAFTIGTPYEFEVRKLHDSIRRFELPHKIYPMQDHGDWFTNCHHIIEVIEQGLKEFPNKNIVWLDADAVIVKNPVLFSTFSRDLGAHRRKNKKDAGYHWNTGTIFYRNNEKVRERIHLMALNMRAYYCGEAEIYYDVDWMLANADKLGLDLGELPTAYSIIFDTKQPEEINVEPVIIHNQASRRLKNV